MSQQSINRFNIRVYGLYVKDLHLLVTDEIRKGIKMTKLPGGGLEYGEGIGECLVREWKEELGVEIDMGDIFFVNPFLQISAFDQREQIVSMYFWVEPLNELDIALRETAMDFEHEEEGQQVFRWVSIQKMKPTAFTFPIDQALVPRLKSFFL